MFIGRIDDSENSRSCDPGDFRRKSFNVFLLSLEYRLRNEHGEVRILDAELLDFGVEPACRKVSGIDEKRDKTADLGFPPRYCRTRA
jgi:hypothetical protein